MHKLTILLALIFITSEEIYSQTSTPSSNFEFLDLKEANPDDINIEDYFSITDQNLIDSINQIINGTASDEVKSFVNSQLSLSQRCTVEYLAKKAKKSDLISFGCHGYTSDYLINESALNQYYGGLRIGRTSTIALDGEEVALYTELISDNMWISSRFGNARVGLGALISNSDTTNSNTTDQFFQSGGNAQLFVQIPFYFWINVINQQSSPIRRFDSFFTLSAGSDLPALGGSVENPAFRTSASFQMELTQRTNASKLRGFITIEGSLMWANPTFYDNVDSRRPDLSILSLWGLPVFKTTFGIDISEIFRVGATYGTSIAFSNTPLLSVQLLPQ